MIIQSCCITILITYICIFGLLTYYFIKKRSIWNELFNINNIKDSLMEIFLCPEHFIIYIPGILFEKTACITKTQLIKKTKDKIRIILTKINIIFKKMNDIGIEDKDMNSDMNSNIKQVKWVLEGTIDNFNHMYEETADFYNKLYGSYDVLHNKSNNEKNENSNVNNTNNLITLEKLVLIESNIENCDIILLLLEYIYSNKDDKETLDFETLFQMKNNYMICLIYHLIESVRFYKIRMHKLSF